MPTNAYADLDDLARRLDLDASGTYDVELDDALNAASRAIDAWCGRVFYADTASTTLYHWPRWDTVFGAWVVDTEDLHTVTSLSFDSGDVGTYTALTVTTDYLATPRNSIVGGISGWPTTGFRLNSAAYVRTKGNHEPYKVIGKLGWSAIPDQVRAGCLILAEELFKMRDAPFGVLQAWNDFGPVRVSGDTFKRVRTLLGPFAKVGGASIGIA